MSQSDQHLRAAAHAAGDAISASYYANAETHHQFSPEFEQKMNLLLLQTRRRPGTSYCKRSQVCSLPLLWAAAFGWPSTRMPAPLFSAGSRSSMKISSSIILKGVHLPHQNLLMNLAGYRRGIIFSGRLTATGQPMYSIQMNPETSYRCCIQPI